MQPAGSDGYLLTVEEVAQALRLSKMTVYRLLHTGAMTHKRVGHSYRVEKGELERYLKDITTERTQ